MFRNSCAGLLLSLVAALSPPLAVAETPAVDPGINAYYHGADPGRWQDIFESPGREVFDRREEILGALGARPGSRIADVGAGSGLFTMLFARAVGPTGTVYAVDISETFVESIGKRASAEGLSNVVPVLSHQKGVELPPASVDLVFLCDTYHHFEYPRSMLSAIHEALAPGGTLAIIDFKRRPGVSSRWITSHVRAGQETVTTEVEQAGFELIDEPLELRQNYFLRFRKQPR